MKEAREGAGTRGAGKRQREGLAGARRAVSNDPGGTEGGG